MRILFLLILLNLYIFSDTIMYPKIFNKMSEPLFSIASKFKKSTNEDEVKKTIENYIQEVNKTIQIGLKADKLNSSNEDKKRYLFALRKLQKQHDFILNKFRKKLLISIRQLNHNDVKEILNNDFSSILLKKSNVLLPTLDYYKKHQNLGEITILDNIIKSKKNQMVILNSNERFVNHGRYVLDKKTGLLWQRNGDASGRLNFYQAKEYAQRYSLDNLKDWRLPTVNELSEINEVKNDIPFIYAPYLYGKTAYWTSEMNYDLEDYAYLFIWPEDDKKGGRNGCYASKNWYYVRAVHDPVD